MSTPRDRIEAKLGLTGPPQTYFREAPPSVPDHKLVRRIGQGAYGEVWLARNALGTWRAVKIVYRDNFKDDRPYEREFAGIRRFEPISRSNEGFIDVLQVGRSEREGWFYYVMELADGADPAATQRADEPSDTYEPRTLSRELHHRRRLPLEECLELGLTLSLALGHLHRHGLIHRDIKPSNIIFVGGVPKLADIGLVTEASGANTYVGTEGFVPPEGPTSSQADIYALGKVLYEAAMGKDRNEFPEPFTEIGTDAESFALMELNTVLMRACAPDVRERYTTADEMHADLALLHSGGSVKRRRKIERHLLLARQIGGVATAVAVVAGVAWFWQHRQTWKMAEFAAENGRLAQEKGRLAETNAWLARMSLRNEIVARENLYAADINLAHQALLLDNLRQARVLLQNHAPDPGEGYRPGFEWRYLWHQSRGDEKLTFPGKIPGAACVAFSADSRLVAAGGSGRAKIWELASREELANLSLTGAVQSVSFSPEGHLLAIATGESVFLWNNHTPEILSRLPGALMQAKFSTDGKHLISCDSKGLVMWKTGSWEKAASLDVPNSWRLRWTKAMNFQMAFSSDAKLLAVLFDDAIRLFTVPELGLAKEIPQIIQTGPSSRPFVAFLPQSRTLATLDATGFGVQLWHGDTGAAGEQIARHSDHILNIDFSRDGALLATSSGDQTIKLWNVSSGELTHSFKGQADEVGSVAFAPNGKLLASVGANDGRTKVWRVESWNSNGFFRAPFEPVGFSADGELIALAPDLRTLRIDPESMRVGEPSSSPITHGRILPVFLSNKSAEVESDNAPIYSTFLGNLTPDGRILGLWRRRELIMELWDIMERRLLCSVPSQKPWVVFAPKLNLFATDTPDESTTLWALPDGTKKWVFNKCKSPFNTLAFSQDKGLILLDEITHMKLWKIEGEHLQAVAEFDPRSRPASGVAFSPDGSLAATAGGGMAGVIRLWEIPSTKPLGLLTGHTRNVITLAFSPDGRTLASISDDRTVRLWHVASRRELLCFRSPREDHWYFNLLFSPDGRALAAHRVDQQGGATWVWHAPSFEEFKTLRQSE